ncbi:hypothetical protein GGI20_003918 [Coemansia sp. BCRC 34301]|nr:hypothetical protein GGI20_003918 [Coemansia sp. BCRC 34301]
MPCPVGHETGDSVGGRVDSQCSLEQQQRQLLLNEHALSALYMTAANVEDLSPATCHSADSDTDNLTFTTSTTNNNSNNNNNCYIKPTSATFSTNYHYNSLKDSSYINNYNISTANSNTKTLAFASNKTSSPSHTTTTTTATSNTIFGTRNMSYSSNTNLSSFGSSSADDQLIGSLFATDFYSPDLQLPTETEPRASLAPSRSLPDLYPTADVYGAPLLSDVFSIEAFAEALASSSSSSASAPTTPAHQQQLTSGPATAPMGMAMYSETPMMAGIDAQYTAYDSFLNTPMNAEHFASPNVNISGALSSEQMLFAPIDELGAKDAANSSSSSAWTEDDLLAQLINGDPEIRHSFVHALVNHISPTVAYQPIGAGASPLSFVSRQSAAAVQANGVDAIATPLMDSFLGLLSPMADFAATPMMTGAATASPAMLELITAAPASLSLAQPVFKAPRLPSRVADDEDDVPLLKRRWSGDEGNDTSDSEQGSSQKRQRQKATGKESRFYCEICNRGFSRQFNMLTHRLTHDPKSQAARPFACEHCPRTFTRKHDMTRHQVTHDDSNAIKCTVCSRGFARQDVLDRHMAAIHKD